MSSHTPGEWKVENLRSGKNGYPNWNTYTVRSPQNVCLAVVGDVDRYHEPDHEANARLIAASPDLLRALQAVLSEADGGWYFESPIAKLARAAIAKATGEDGAK